MKKRTKAVQTANVLKQFDKIRRNLLAIFS